MKHIRQKHLAGCGVACIAMLTGLTYKQVLKHVYPKRWFWQKVKPFPLGPALWSLGWEYHEVIFPRYPIRQVSKPAIFIIQWTEEDRTKFPFFDVEAHAVVWDPITQTIFDPALKYAQSIEYYQKRTVGYYQLSKRRK